MPSRKGFDGPLLHSRNVPHVLVLLLPGLRRAGVFAGLNSENRKPATHPPLASGFLVSGCKAPTCTVQ
jgi:hypothetical protein